MSTSGALARADAVELLFSQTAIGPETPDVTVAVSVCDYERYLEETLDSIREQTLACLDLVVVDDASSDRSAEVALAWLERHHARFARSLLLRHARNRGPGAARNTAFGHARTKHVFVCDAEDPLYPRCLTRLLEALHASEAGFAYSYVEDFEDEHWIWNRRPWHLDMLREGPLIHVSALVRRELWIRAGGYDEDPQLAGWEDHDFWLRVARAGDAGILVPEILGRYRIHADSISRALSPAVHVDILWDRLFMKHPELFMSAPCSLPDQLRWLDGVPHGIDSLTRRAETIQVRGWVSGEGWFNSGDVVLALIGTDRCYGFATRREDRAEAAARALGFNACFPVRSVARGRYRLGVIVGRPPGTQAVATDVTLNLRGAPGPGAPKTFVLLYHRIAEPADGDPNRLCVPPDVFRAQLGWIAGRFRFLRLDELRDGLSKGELAEGGVVVTFDDGYSANMGTAVPILEELGVPATFFVTSETLDRDCEPDSEELWRILCFNSNVSRRVLRLVIEGVEHRLVPSHREDDCLRVFHLLRQVSRSELVDQLAALRREVGLPTAGRPELRPLTTPQLHELARSPLFEIGSHSMTHPTLSRESPETARFEIVESRLKLERLVGRAVTSFAYPYGGLHDLTFRTAAEVERAGYLCGLTTFPAAASVTSDRFCLPRLHVEGWNPAMLGRRLARLTVR